LYCELAGSDKFKRPREIEKAQMARLLKQFMGLAESEQDPEWTDWADENPDRWADFFHVHVDFDIDEDLVEWLRADKVRFCDEMAGQYEVWRQNPQPFDEDVKSNLASWMSYRVLLIPYVRPRNLACGEGIRWFASRSSGTGR
jgi:hypothetical protein